MKLSNKIKWQQNWASFSVIKIRLYWFDGQQNDSQDKYPQILPDEIRDNRPNNHSEENAAPLQTDKVNW